MLTFHLIPIFFQDVDDSGTESDDETDLEVSCGDLDPEVTCGDDLEADMEGGEPESKISFF